MTEPISPPVALLPGTPQPDIGPDQLPPRTPSLFLYLAITLVGLGFIALAWQWEADWPGLLINLGSSLLTTVIILIFVDQRLRRSEITALQKLPRRVTLNLWLVMSPRRRQVYHFAQLQLAALDKLTQGKITPASVTEIAVREGSFVLLGEPGSGKTTILQILCQARSRDFIAGQSPRLPILYPLRYWLGDQPLRDAIFSHVSSIYPVSRAAFDKTLARYPMLIILDGADEVHVDYRSGLHDEIARFRESVAEADWIISSRSIYPIPSDDFPRVDLTPLSQTEILEILRRLRSGQ